MSLLPPHGGTIKDLFLPAAETETEKRNTRDYPSWDLTPQWLYELAMLLNGAFLPVGGFTGTLADLHNNSWFRDEEHACRTALTQVFAKRNKDEADKQA